MLKRDRPTVSSFCDLDDAKCVLVRWRYEHSDDSPTVEVTDSKESGAPQVLSFTVAEWEAFTVGVKAGEFDVPEPLPVVPGSSPVSPRRIISRPS